jgi:hypothetical protein
MRILIKHVLCVVANTYPIIGTGGADHRGKPLQDRLIDMNPVIGLLKVCIGVIVKDVFCPLDI